MATAEELLQNAAETLSESAAEVCVIDEETRTINVPPGESLFGVTGDKDVERKYFQCPKIVGDNIDLSQHQIYIVYVFTSTQNSTVFPSVGIDKYHCEDVKVSGDNITFSWKLSGNVLATPGFIAFKVMAAKNEGSNLKTKWNTAPAFGTVLITVPDGEEIAEEYPDIINQLFEEMEKVQEIATPEAMKGYVEEYMQEHPVTGGMTEEQEQQLNQNTQDVADLKSAINIEDATIYDIPSNLMAKPEFSYVNYVNKSLDDVLVKPALIQYAGNMFFPNTKNIDGGTEDLPETSGTGVTSVVYRKFLWYNNEPTNETNGTIAQKGTEYTDYTGIKKSMPGGAGYSSAVSTGGYTGKVYFAFVDSGKNSVNVNGAYQSLTPCCVDININTDNMIGEIKELSLTIEGEKGQFDLARLGYKSYYTYYTTIAPHYRSNTYHIALAVPDGIVYCTSSDGINWTYMRTYKTPFEPRYEIALAINNAGNMVFACRAPYDKQNMYIVHIKNTSSETISKIYRIVDIGSRPCLIAVGNNFYLMHSTTSRNVCEVLQIICNGNYDLFFYRWFEMYKTMTYYPIMVTTSNLQEKNAFGTWYIVGNNGVHTEKTGISWATVKCNTELPFRASDCVYPSITQEAPEEPDTEEPEGTGSLPFNNLSSMYCHNSKISFSDDVLIFNNAGNILGNFAEINPLLLYKDYKGKTVVIKAKIKSDNWNSVSDWIGLYAWLYNKNDIATSANNRVKYQRVLNITDLTSEFIEYSTEFLLEDNSFTSGTGSITGNEYLSFGILSQYNAIVSEYSVTVKDVK